MYNTNTSEALTSQKIFETASRIAETFSLFVKSVLYKKKEENAAFSYFHGLIKKGSTIIDIGTHNGDYLYFLLKMEKYPVKLISFECDPHIYQYLFQKKETLKLKNVVIEQLALSEETEKILPVPALKKRNDATVIDFKTGKNQDANKPVALDKLNKYCEVYDLQPDVLFLQCKGNELTILNSAAEMLKKYKPKILLECQEKHSGRERILQTFEFLSRLNYSGYFILDTMKIPVINFDFNIYQNQLSNFYCKDFIFE